MKHYYSDLDGKVYVRKDGQSFEQARELNPRFDLANHSPTWFNLGYQGSGPAQLALALLADCVGAERALKNYQDFKRKVVALFLPDTTWSLSERRLLRNLKEIEDYEQRLERREAKAGA